MVRASYEASSVKSGSFIWKLETVFFSDALLEMFYHFLRRIFNILGRELRIFVNFDEVLVFYLPHPELTNWCNIYIFKKSGLFFQVLCKILLFFYRTGKQLNKLWIPSPCVNRRKYISLNISFYKADICFHRNNIYMYLLTDLCSFVEITGSFGLIFVRFNFNW